MKNSTWLLILIAINLLLALIDNLIDNASTEFINQLNETK